jgi:sugar/nucleoside kinase (ribokinase family)
MTEIEQKIWDKAYAAASHLPEQQAEKAVRRFRDARALAMAGIEPIQPPKGSSTLHAIRDALSSGRLVWFNINDCRVILDRQIDESKIEEAAKWLDSEQRKRDVVRLGEWPACQ